MDYHQLPIAISLQDSIKALESDIHHANMLAASISGANGDGFLQMKLEYNHFTPIVLFVLQWMDWTCECLLPNCLNLFRIVVYKVTSDGKEVFTSYGRRATVRQFYAVILPSLQCLYDSSLLLHNDRDKGCGIKMVVRKRLEGSNKFVDGEMDREDECGICLEPCTRMVLPNCCHAMCINCYQDWSLRSASCPFCRGSLKRINSGDLWVLTCDKDATDQESLLEEDTLRLHLYINSLPIDVPDSLFLVYYEYLI